MNLTVKDLKEKLEGLDESLPIYVPCSSGEYDYVVCHQAKVKSLTLTDIADSGVEQLALVMDEY